MANENYYLYILASKKNGTLYVGVTGDLVKRIYEHKQNTVDGFTKKYNVHNLVYYEVYRDIEEAILREKQMKKWNRKWKIKIIEDGNPKWKDLSKGYAKAKEQEYPGKKILERTGALRKSLTMRNDKYSRCKISDKDIEIGSELKTPDGRHTLWMLHQRGWKKPEIRSKGGGVLSWVGPNGQVFSSISRAVEVPKRQPIKISKPQANRWMKILYTYVQEIATGKRSK